MWLEAQELEQAVSGETGLAFEALTGADAGGERWYLLRPRGLLPDHGFGIRILIGWRRLRIAFEPGKFAGELLTAMGQTDETGLAAFRAVLADCAYRGAQIDLRVNGREYQFDQGELWSQEWSRFHSWLHNSP